MLGQYIVYTYISVFAGQLCVFFVCSIRLIKIKRALLWAPRAIAARLCAFASFYWRWTQWFHNSMPSFSSTSTASQHSQLPAVSRTAAAASSAESPKKAPLSGRGMLKALNDRLCMQCSSLQRRLQYEVGSIRNLSEWNCRIIWWRNFRMYYAIIIFSHMVRMKLIKC